MTSPTLIFYHTGASRVSKRARAFSLFGGEGAEAKEAGSGAEASGTRLRAYVARARSYWPSASDAPRKGRTGAPDIENATVAALVSGWTPS